MTTRIRKIAKFAKKAVEIFLACSLAFLASCGESRPATVLYVENDSYNLTPQEYIDLMNSSIEQQDANYPTIPDWDEDSASLEIGSWFNRLSIEENDDGKITRISYHWEVKNQEQTDAAYFMAGLTIGMAVGPENIQTVYDALDMTKTGVSSYINECDNNGSNFYFMSYGYGRYNDLHISPVEPNAEEVPVESET